MIYDCDTHSRLWYLNFIAILSFVYPKLACIELLISLYIDRQLFADGFVTVKPIAMKIGCDKDSVSSLKVYKISLKSVKFQQEINDDVQIDLKKKWRLPHLEPVQNGLMQNVFCTENEYLHAFFAPTKNRTNG